MYTLLLFIILVKSEYATMGLTSNFHVVPDTFGKCNNTIDCFYQVCDVLQNTSFAMMTSVSENQPLDNTQIPVNMIVFGLDPNKRMIIKNSSLTCNSFVKCMYYGTHTLKKQNWIIYAGQCLFNTTKIYTKN